MVPEPEATIRWQSQHDNQGAAGNINKEHKKTQGISDNTK